MYEFTAQQLEQIHATRKAILDEDNRKKKLMAMASNTKGGDSGGSGGKIKTNEPSSPTISQKQRLTNIASGAQPVVIKIASTMSASSLSAAAAYLSRDDKLLIENERGELVNLQAIEESKEEWDELVIYRESTKDIGTFELNIDNNELSIEEASNIAHGALKQAFDDRKHLFEIERSLDGGFKASGIVALRSKTGEKYTADDKGSEIANSRIENLSNTSCDLKFGTSGHSINYGLIKGRELFENKFDEQKIYNQDFKSIKNEKDFESQVHRWKYGMHSRKSRDLFHIIISSKAGTDVINFNNTVHDFLSNEFGGHKYLVAIHDPKTDPIAEDDNGSKQHVHAHVIMTVRNKYGESLRPNIGTFKEWRTNFAEHARNNDLRFEMTDRREFASQPAYKLKDTYQKNGRYDRVLRKQENKPVINNSSKNQKFVKTVKNTWENISKESLDPNIKVKVAELCARFKLENPKLDNIIKQNEIDKNMSKLDASLNRYNEAVTQFNDKLNSIIKNYKPEKQNSAGNQSLEKHQRDHDQQRSNSRKSDLER